MVSPRNEAVIKEELVKYLSNIGLDIHTKTKARGHKGFFKEGRIDISKSLDDSSALRTILHEFAHYINYLLDKTFKNSFVLFDCDIRNFQDELLCVTNFVDENSLCLNLINERNKINVSIKDLTSKIKSVYPQFSLSKEFKHFKRYAMWSNLGYLEKYDRVKLLNWFSHKTYSVANVRKDFPNIPDVFVHYLKLKSQDRKRKRINARISRFNKYYSTPTELFARFIEGLYIDKDFVKELAPNTYNRFAELYKTGYYKELEMIFDLIGTDIS